MQTGYVHLTIISYVRRTTRFITYVHVRVTGQANGQKTDTCFLMKLLKSSIDFTHSIRVVGIIKSVVNDAFRPSPPPVQYSFLLLQVSRHVQVSLIPFAFLS